MGDKMNDNVIFAKAINDCENCPLYKHDCIGGYTSNGNGTPIEPPCCSWNENDEIFEGMYENNTYEPLEKELVWEREEQTKRERNQREKRIIKDKEDTLRQIKSISKYGNAKIRNSGELCWEWFCPRCNRWFHAWYESIHSGITETSCNHCGQTLAYSSLIEDK
jgi:hypothetical protein